MSRLLVTGGSGFAGGNFITQARGSCDLHVIVRRPETLDTRGLHVHVCDLADESKLRAAFESARPNAVVHMAAASDIDWCEAHEDSARRMNAGVTGLLAALSRRFGAKLVFYSTDSIFDGTMGPYTEEDEPAPLNVYARTKVEAEGIVIHAGAPWVIARPSLILGFPVGDGGNSFLLKMAQSLKDGRTVAFPSAETRTPIDVITLSRAALELAVGNHQGIFHLSGNQALTRFDMARRLCARLGFAPSLVIDKKPEIATGRARRPADVSLSNAKARRALATPLLDFDAAMEQVFQQGGEGRS